MKLKTAILAAAIGLAGSLGAHAAEKDIVDTAVEAGQFKTLAAALEAAGLVETLKGAGPFTVFAPTDEAFAKLPAGTVENLLKPENKDQLTAILTYHVVPGKVMAARRGGIDEARTVNGKMIDVEVDGSSVKVNDATVTAADVAASNGVIHVIDTVILPPEADAQPQPRRRTMKFINILTLILVIVGGLNWGLVGLFDFDLVAAIFGGGSALSRIVYVLVGLSAAWQIAPLFSAMSSGEIAAERTGSRSGGPPDSRRLPPPSCSMDGFPAHAGRLQHRQLRRRRNGRLFRPGEWYGQLDKPPWRPPDWLFAPVWTVLYAMIALSGWLVWREAGFAGAALPLTIYGLQLILNAAWTPIFFGLRRPDLAVIEIALVWASILATICFSSRQPRRGLAARPVPGLGELRRCAQLFHMAAQPAATSRKETDDTTLDRGARRMQQGSRYALVAPADSASIRISGRTSRRRTCWHRGVRGQVHDRLPRRVPGELVCRRQTVAGEARPLAQLLRRRREPAAQRLARKGLDSSARSARLVPVVLRYYRDAGWPARMSGRSAAGRPFAPRRPTASRLRARRRWCRPRHARRYCTGPMTAVLYDP